MDVLQTAAPGVRTAQARSVPATRGRRSRTVGLIALLVALVVVLVLGLAVGARTIPPSDVWRVVTGVDRGQDRTTVLDMRLPRTLIGLVAGAALGVSGTLTQAVTRNPLADPGLLGVNAGAAFALALGTGFLGVSGNLGTLVLAFVGAVVATVAVYAVGSAGRGGARPARLTLAGVALGAVLAGITRAIMLTDPARFAGMLAWQSGSLVDRDAGLLLVALPFVGVGLLIALGLAGSLNAVALGDDLAQALGTNVVLVRALAVVSVTLLAGTATALAGPISFVGLMVPHVVRWIVGPDHRWIVAYSILAAPVLLIVSDVIGRVVLSPGELPAGIVTALLGAPALIVLVRRRRGSEL